MSLSLKKQWNDRSWINEVMIQVLLPLNIVEYSDGIVK